MGFDSSVFMTLDMARKLGEIATPEKSEEIAKSLSAILVRVKPGVDPISISDGVLDKLGLRANVNFVFASNMMSDTSAKLQKIVGIMYSVAGVFWLIAALVMFVVYFFAFNERQKEFATLRALGASKRRVIGIVLGESTILSTIGAVVGILFGLIVVNFFSVSISRTIGLPYLAPEAGAWAEAFVIALVAGVITCPLAALPTAWRIGRKDIYTSLREGE